ncbi:MAG TPA: TM2 domain-containing protein [Planctomycetota bacterium]|nr:TM2 domain-containing protein [Planctomycetota bacterium]HQB01331.1 TM2 domain-containing protein [Planctomycetota bacterium]
MNEDQLLVILKDQGLLTEAGERACLEYQEGYLAQTGKEISTHKVLLKLELVSESAIQSVCKALEQLQGRVEEEEESEEYEIEEEIEEEVSEHEEEVSEHEEEVSEHEEKKYSSFVGLSTRQESSQMPKNITPAFLKKPQAWDEEEVEEDSPLYQKPVVESCSKSLFVAYFLLFFTGIFGGHRFYLGHYRSGILYSLTLGFFGLGLLWDLIYLPFLKKSYDPEYDSEEFFIDSEYVDAIHVGHPAPWYNGLEGFKKILFGIESIFQYVFLLIAPFILGFIAYFFAKPICLIIVILWSIVFVFNISFTKFLRVRGGSQHVPFLELINNSINRLLVVCYKKRPSFFLLYLLYPLWLPFLCIISRRKRKEYFSFLWIFIAIILSILVSIFYLVDTMEPMQQKCLAQIGYYGIFVLCFFIVIVMSFVSLAKIRVCQHIKTAKGFSIWTLLICLVFFIVLFWGYIPLPDVSETLPLRLENAYQKYYVVPMKEWNSPLEKQFYYENE